MLLVRSRCLGPLAALAFLTAALPVLAQAPAPSYPPTHWPIHDGSYVIHDFHFGTGETLPELKLHYLTLGTPHRNPAGHVDNAVLLLHGTGGNAHSLLNPVFSDVLFGPGQPIDITKYFLILPDDIGMGESSKPSDGLRMKFPHYDYDDMVHSSTPCFSKDCTSIICGSSLARRWAACKASSGAKRISFFADALAPFACMPIEIAGRNRMWRYMAMQSIRDDPQWDNGNYTQEPAEG